MIWLFLLLGAVLCAQEEPRVTTDVVECGEPPAAKSSPWLQYREWKVRAQIRIGAENPKGLCALLRVLQAQNSNKPAKQLVLSRKLGEQAWLYELELQGFDNTGQNLLVIQSSGAGDYVHNEAVIVHLLTGRLRSFDLEKLMAGRFPDSCPAQFFSAGWLDDTELLISVQAQQDLGPGDKSCITQPQWKLNLNTRKVAPVRFRKPLPVRGKVLPYR